MTEELRRDIQRRVHAVQRHYDHGGRVLRALWVIAAALVTLVGLAMTVLPGPAIIVIPVGLAMLGARYRWAQAVLRTVIEHGVAWQRRLVKASAPVRLGLAAATLTVLGGIALLMIR